MIYKKLILKVFINYLFYKLISLQPPDVCSTAASTNAYIST